MVSRQCILDHAPLWHRMASWTMSRGCILPHASEPLWTFRDTTGGTQCRCVDPFPGENPQDDSQNTVRRSHPLPLALYHLTSRSKGTTDDWQDDVHPLSFTDELKGV